MFSKEQKKIIAVSSLGGALEFYDFVIFIFLAKTIGELFFPLADPVASLMASFAVFAVGYLARPLGAVLFGHFGDKFGRKKTFVATVFLMAIPTFLIGLLPTYHSAGIWASALLILLRVLQGFSLGGEIPGALVFIGETVAPERRGFATGLILLGINTGLLTGSFVGALVVHLSAPHLLTWGWRIPFFFGGLLGIVSFYLRKRMQETPLFKKLEHQQQYVHLPIKETFRKYFPQVLQGTLITSLCAVMVSLFYLFMPTYLATFFHFPLAKLLTLNTVNIFIFALSVVLVGYLSDKVGRKKIMNIGLVFFILFTYPLFLLFKHSEFAWVILVTATCGIFAIFIAGVVPCLLAELFPTKVRYSGVAICYNFAFGVIGGLTPLVLTALIHHTHNVFVPAWIVMFMAMLTLITLRFVPETSRRPLHD